MGLFVITWGENLENKNWGTHRQKGGTTPRLAPSLKTLYYRRYHVVHGTETFRY
jgi:hypothetical protein